MPRTPPVRAVSLRAAGRIPSQASQERQAMRGEGGCGGTGARVTGFAWTPGSAVVANAGSTASVVALRGMRLRAPVTIVDNNDHTYNDHGTETVNVDGDPD